MGLSAALAGLAILSIAKPAFCDPSGIETFRGSKGNYYRIPPGYLWEVGAYNYTIQIPRGAEACTDDWIISGHGPAIGPSNMPCLDVFKHPAAVLYAGITIAYSDPIRKETLIQQTCGKHRVKKTSMVVDGHSFLKCWDYDPDVKSRYMNYFTFSEPNPGLGFHVYIFCPSSGNCKQWVAKWERLIFENLHIHWQDDKDSEVTNGKVNGQSK